MENVWTWPSRKLASGVPRVGDARQVAADRVERERAGRRRRLDDVQPLPPPIESHLERVAPFQPRQRIGDLGDARVEVRRRVRRRAELLVAADEKRRQRVGELRGRRDAGNAEGGSGRCRELGGGPPDGAARVADAQLVQHVRPRTCAGSSTQTPTPSCPAGPACRS